MAELETPDWAATDAEAIRRGVADAIDEAERRVDAIASVPDGARTFENTMLALDEIGDIIGQASGRFGFLAQVSDDAELRGVAHEEEQRLDVFAAGLGFREELDRALKAYAARAETEALPDDAARLLEFALRDYRRNGFDLPAEQRGAVRELHERLVRLGIQFRRNIDDYEDAIHVSRAQLAGLPDSYVERLQTSGENSETNEDEAERYRVSLDYPELHPFLDSADDGELRRELFLKNHNKAADNNIELLEEAIGVRDEIAQRLGYPSWAAYVLELRMAKSPDNVLEFLTDLEARLAPKLADDLALLRREQQRRAGAGGPVKIWDWRYYTNRLLLEEHRVDPFEVAAYFPLEAVLDGMFDVYQQLVGVRFVARPDAAAQAWHPDARPYDIVDPAGGEPLARFYMDLHPRPGKFGHAAAFTLRGGRETTDGGYQRPISAIVANFTRPTPDSPSLLRHGEVITLFHEFGHILHQTLTRARFTRFSGTRVERDFVEAPSQMLEHWCWERDVLAKFSRHWQTGDPLPDDLLERMIAAKHVSSGVANLRQVYFARLDLAYHGPGGQKDSDAIARELHPITGFEFPENTHFQAGFGHLFGYDAGYYGYLWSRVYGDDMFTRFEGAASSPQTIGREYRKRILEPGGAQDGETLVKSFLGREPTPEAFLRELGIG